MIKKAKLMMILKNGKESFVLKKQISAKIRLVLYVVAAKKKNCCFCEQC